MSMIRMCVFAIGLPALLLGLACLGVGCGGSGGGSGPAYTNADFSGLYQVLYMRVSRTGLVVESSYGEVVADGVGMVTPTIGSDTNGTSTSPMLGASVPYTVAGDGSMAFSGLIGQIACGGDCVLLDEQSSGDQPTACVLIRRSGLYGNPLLSGDYHMAGMTAVDTAAATYWTSDGIAQGPVSFNGAGLGLYPSVSTNSDGTLGGPPGGTAGYSVGPSGATTFEPTFFGEGLGTVTPDGNFVGLCGATDSSSPYFNFFVRAGTGLSNSTFSGTYRVLGISRSVGPTGNFVVFSGTAVADGLGGLFYPSLVLNVEGAIFAGARAGVAYGVASNGLLMAGDEEGAVSPDGRFAVLAGGTTPGAAPSLVLYVRP